MALFAARSDKGPVRSTNQDACCVEVAQTRFGDAVMAVVCDGVGGLEHGEVASTHVARAFDQWFAREFPSLLSSMDVRFAGQVVEDSWHELLCRLNQELRNLGARDGAMLGTTFTGVLACSGCYVVGHVGDCRLYCLNGQDLTQITEDQTLVAREVARGHMSEEEARTDARRNVILQAVGVTPGLRPSFYRGPWRMRDLFVLCSDGAYRMAGDEGIRAAFSHTGHAEVGLNMACHALIERALTQGETDNLTVACFLAGEGSSQSSKSPVLLASGAVCVGGE